MEELFISKFWDAVKEFFDSINWLFMLIFMIITWLVNASLQLKKLEDRTLQSWFVLVIGVGLAILYAYLYDIWDKPGIAGLLYGILAGMVIWKLGISKFEEFIKNKIWKK